jgi:hypothetical protein
MHKPIQEAEDLQPQLGHSRHALLTELDQVMEEDFAEEAGCSEASFAHPVGISAEDLGLQEFLEDGEEDAFKDDRQVDVPVRQDLRGHQGAL